MTAARRRQAQRPRARGLCRAFAGNLARFAVAGNGALLADHRPLVEGDIACSMDLDRSLKRAYPRDDRWDYLLVPRSSQMSVVGMEVHHAAAAEVAKMIKKKEWARALLRRECRSASIHSWHWIIPTSGVLLFTPNDPRAKLLATAGITFPRKHLALP